MYIVFLIILACLMHAEEGSLDVMYANWLNKSWETQDGRKAEQDINPGFMTRIKYENHTANLKPVGSIAQSEKSKAIIGMLGLSYEFEDIVIGVETEAGSFEANTKINGSSFDGTCTYNSVKVKCGSDRIGGFLSYKRLKAPNIDIFVDKSDGTIYDMYYDKDFMSQTATIGMYGKFSGYGLSLEFNNGLGVTYGQPGNDVQDAVSRDWNTQAKGHYGVGLDMTIDLKYSQRISHGIWFVGFRGTAFGHIDAISTAIEQGDSESNKNDGKVNPELRASRIDMYYGPYVGLGLVF